ncbi:hypothetical protein Daus18300_003753 [Diaporthe australafricana]|uniref:1-alkyl-2-acetylglycerophosphocholine esterase n=1 Tax=Diaporthe australafricana TaxID=127596 RepID=A0ABR3XDR0_9PEZI
MSPVVRASAAALTGVLKIISGLSGGSNGPPVTDFNNSSINILPLLPGPNKTGVFNFFVSDVERHHFPLCDISSDEIPDLFCQRPREIPISVLKLGPVLRDDQYFAPVFSPPVLDSISKSVDGGPAGLHNIMSPAVVLAPACKGQYPVTIFAPTIGGQRQAYTQAASELASKGHIVVAVDHPYLSGVVIQPSDETVNLGVFDTWINPREALSIQTEDLQHVVSRITEAEKTLAGLSFTDQSDLCVFGHGSGGQVAQMMVDNHVVKCGGPLEGVLRLPAPFNEEEPDAGSQTPANSTNTVSSKEQFPTHGPLGSLRNLGAAVMKMIGHVTNITPADSSKNLSTDESQLVQSLQGLQAAAANSFAYIVCELQGNCETQEPLQGASIQERSVSDDPGYPRYPPEKPCYEDHCGDDYGYTDGDDKYHDPCEEPCDTYEPCDPCDDPYSVPPRPYPPTPYPPPGIFPPGILPPNITWPPYGDDKTRPDDRPWDDQWDDYHKGGGDYEQKYGGGEDCDHHGGYNDRYEWDDDDKYHGDHGHDHYREWDRKHHPHGNVDDYDEDKDHDDKDDYGGDEFNYGDQDGYEHDYDEGDDHGNVDDWDDEGDE